MEQKSLEYELMLNEVRKREGKKGKKGKKGKGKGKGKKCTCDCELHGGERVVQGNEVADGQASIGLLESRMEEMILRIETE